MTQNLEDGMEEGEGEVYVVLVVDGIVQHLWPLDDFVRSNVWVSFNGLLKVSAQLLSIANHKTPDNSPRAKP